MRKQLGMMTGAWALALVFGGSAVAGGFNVEELIKEGPGAILLRSDLEANPYPDRTMSVEMVLKGGGDDGKVLGMKMYSKGATRTALRFKSPSDLKGLALVIKGASEIYVKLPGTKKVRRVASHARKQGFQGTDWSLDDLRLLKLAPSFSPTLKEVTATHIVLNLERKSEADLPYKRLVVHLPKAHLVPETIEYYDDDGKKIKVQTRDGLVESEGGKKSFLKNTMTDLVRNHSTLLNVLEQSTDPISEKTFSKRWLVRGT